MTSLWFNQAHAQQREIAALIRQAFDNQVTVIASHRQNREEILSSADQNFIEPTGKSPQDYAVWALEKATSLQVSAVVAVRKRAALLTIRPEFQRRNIRLIAGASDPLHLELCENKARLTEFLAASAVPVIHTIEVESPDALAAAITAIEATGTDACIKPSVGVFGQGFWHLNRRLSPFAHFAALHPNAVHPDAFLAAYRAAPPAYPMVVMEYLPGTEHSVDCVCEDGRVLAVAARRKEAFYQVVDTAGEPVELARRVAGLLRLDGLVNIQTRADAAGQHRLLEVNTRPSGGVSYSAAAGINLPAALAAMALGLPLPAFPATGPTAVRILETAFALPETSARLARKTR